MEDHSLAERRNGRLGRHHVDQHRLSSKDAADGFPVGLLDHH
jgi:hypothetical protein